MLWLMPSAVMSAASAILLLSVYLYVYARQRERCFLLWAAGLAAVLARYPALLWMRTHGPWPALQAFSELAALAGGLLTVSATRAFVGLRPGRAWKLYRIASLAAAIWLMVSCLSGLPTPYCYLPPSWLTAVGAAWSGLQLLRSARLPRPSNRYVGWAFALTSVHHLMYPFVEGHTGVTTAGCLAGAVVRAIIAIGMLIASMDTLRAKLAESEQRYDLLAETASDVILLIDAQGMIAYANHAGRRLLGLAEKGPHGRAFADFVVEGQRGSLPAFRQECLSGSAGTHLHEITVINATGATVTLEATCSPMRDQAGEPLILVVARDTSERVQQQRSLAALMGNLPGMVYRCQDDEERTLTYVSAGAEELTGLTIDSLDRDGGVTHASLVHPEDARRVRDEINTAVANGRPFDIEYRLCDVRGGTKWVRDRGRAVDAGGGRYTIEGFVSDVSEGKRLSEQLRQAQKLDEIGRLAGGIAHDFNNLLTAITGYGHFLKQALPESHPAQHDVAGLLATTDKASHLTKQLLAFSRRQASETRPVNLNELVTNTGQLLRRLIGEDIEITVITDDSLRTVEGDPGQLEQALVNLVVNARDAMPNGGRLTIETAQVTLDADDAAANPAVQPGDYAVLAVSDTGIGMSDTVKEHLFEPFFTTKEAGRGTGLGLAIVYGTVQQHRGDIQVISEPGQGTVVRLYLPCIAANTTQATKASVPASLPRGSETVLVAEDEVSVRTLVLRILEDLGYAVLEAGDGSEALRRADEYDGHIHLLLTDLVMPLMGGRQLDAALRERRPALRTLYMSGYTDSAVLHRGLLGPEAAFLQKPFTARALAVAVRRALDRQPAPTRPAAPHSPRAEMTPLPHA